MEIIVFQSRKRLVDPCGEKILRLEGGGTTVASVVERGFHYGQHKFKEIEVGRVEEILAG
jgi:hypothetical protein